MLIECDMGHLGNFVNSFTHIFVFHKQFDLFNGKLGFDVGLGGLSSI